MHEADRVTVPYLDAAVSRARQLVLGSDLGPSSLPRPPRLGALPAVPEHPVRALALLPAVPRARTAGGAVAAALEMLLLARRRLGQAGGRHAARAAAPPAEHRERLSKGRAAVGLEARDVERGAQCADPSGDDGGCIGAVGATLEEQFGDAGVARKRGEHERSDAGVSVTGQRGEVDVRAAGQKGEGDLGEAELAGVAERSHAMAVDGVGACG
jgi:hypothetical protein